MTPNYLVVKYFYSLFIKNKNKTEAKKTPKNNNNNNFIHIIKMPLLGLWTNLTNP